MTEHSFKIWQSLSGFRKIQHVFIFRVEVKQLVISVTGIQHRAGDKRHTLGLDLQELAS